MPVAAAGDAVIAGAAAAAAAAGAAAPAETTDTAAAGALTAAAGAAAAGDSFLIVSAGAEATGASTRGLLLGVTGSLGGVTTTAGLSLAAGTALSPRWRPADVASDELRPVSVVGAALEAV